MSAKIWVTDFEYNETDKGEIPHPVCFSAQELLTGERIDLWLDDEPHPEPIQFSNPELIYVSFYGVGDLQCHISLGWSLPVNLIDLFAEWRLLSNTTHKPNEKAGLLDVCDVFDIETITTEEKEMWRERILQGSPYAIEERQGIMKYCYADVDITLKLFNKMSPYIENWHGALFRGKIMIITAKMEARGIPIDKKIYALLKDNWQIIKLKILEQVKAEYEGYDLFDGTTFKLEEFQRYLFDHNLSWEITKTGRLSTKDEVFKDAAKYHPELQTLYEAKQITSTFKTFPVEMGADGRSRAMLSPFRSVTGRFGGKAGYIFLNPTWVRSLIIPDKGKMLLYMDYEQEEFCIVAALSGDEKMLETYNSGDPYLYFAKLTQEIPPNGTKETHKEIRDKYKAGCLALQYGMGVDSLSKKLGIPPAYANQFIQRHQSKFKRYWRWKEDILFQSKSNKYAITEQGWRVRVEQGSRKEDYTLGNFHAQSVGADILKMALYKLDEADIKVIAPIHDAVLIEVDEAITDVEIENIENIMIEASKEVIGVPIRLETKKITSEEHYTDKRGVKTWGIVKNILADIENGLCEVPDEAYGSVYYKTVDTLTRCSKKHLSNWFDGHEPDTIDFEAIYDSGINATENKENLKKKWKDFL